MSTSQQAPSEEGRALDILLAAANVVGEHVAPEENPAGQADLSFEAEGSRTYPTPSSMAAAIDRMATVCTEQFSAINGRLDALSQRVNSLASTGPSPSTPASTFTLEEITGVQYTPWADRSVNNSETDDDSVLVFPEEA